MQIAEDKTKEKLLKRSVKGRNQGKKSVDVWKRNKEILKNVRNTDFIGSFKKNHQNRSTDFFNRNSLIWEEIASIVIITTENTVVLPYLWGIDSSKWLRISSIVCFTLPMRNWHTIKIISWYTIIQVSHVLPYLWGIDTPYSSLLLSTGFCFTLPMRNQHNRTNIVQRHFLQKPGNVFLWYWKSLAVLKRCL